MLTIKARDHGWTCWEAGLTPLSLRGETVSPHVKRVHENFSDGQLGTSVNARGISFPPDLANGLLRRSQNKTPNCVSLSQMSERNEREKEGKRN